MAFFERSIEKSIGLNVGYLKWPNLKNPGNIWDILGSLVKVHLKGSQSLEMPFKLTQLGEGI